MPNKALVKGRALVLASASPARLGLLRQLGYNVVASPTRIKETLGSPLPGPAAEGLARRKLEAFLASKGASAGAAGRCGGLQASGSSRAGSDPVAGADAAERAGLAMCADSGAGAAAGADAAEREGVKPGAGPATRSHSGAGAAAGAALGPGAAHGPDKGAESGRGAAPGPGGAAVPVLACDTLIWFENRIIGKPRSTEEARAHLRGFSGRTHQVFTGYALWDGEGTTSGWDMAEVDFREIGDDEIEECLGTGEHQGAAGSYRIQGFAARFVSRIRGDWATVVGVPVKKLGLQPKWTRTKTTTSRTKPRIWNVR